MASSEGLDESVDFDFFETPRSPVKDFNDSEIKNSKIKDITNPVSKPPVQPKGSTSVSLHSKNAVAKSENSANSESSSESSSDHYSDSESMSSNSVDRKTKSRNSLYSKSSVSVSSRSTVSSLSSDKDIKLVNKKKNQEKNNKNDSSSSSESDDEEGSSNPTAKSTKENMSEKKVESDYSTDFSEEEEEKYKKYSKMSRPQRDDDGDYKRSRKTKKVETIKSQAWDEGTDLPKQSAKDRPKTAKGRVRIPTDSKMEFKSGSNSFSDSDITDVSPIESPRNTKDKNIVKGRGEGMGIRSAGDGYYGKRQYAPMTDIDMEDPDRLGSLDLSILMKAVGELEKQTRLKSNTRRVMFAPMSVNRGERGNYSFDENQTREIERENNRLLKEIVRRVSSREHTRGCARNHAQKLTPSAVNRERDIRRIEMENLAILKRLKKVKPTKSISRENQLKEYESTMLHGVPMAALHPMPRVGRHTAYDESASSMSSFTSGVSSVRSLSSRLSSRPGSAVRRPTSAKRYTSDRPDWSDRW